MALKVPAHLILLHVVEPPPQVPEASITYDVAALKRSLREHGQEMLARARAECEAAGLTAETDLREADGRVADTIAERIAARACDLVVMGTHGRRGASRWVMGSDAEIVARHSPVPVLLVRSAG
jgi:nucleotide-binding universal stress UspA family protein